MGLALCGASPATPTYVDGVGRVDLCARHAAEAMGIAPKGPIKLPAKDPPKRRPMMGDGPMHQVGRSILAYIEANPGTTQLGIGEALSIHKTTVSNWIVKLTKAGFLRGMGVKHSPTPWRYYVIARPPEE